MGDSFAVVVGIEVYSGASIPPVLLATEDAKAFADVLEALGVPRGNIKLLVNEKATAIAIESEIRTTLNALAEDDECFIFFAGHGFSDGFHNYLAAHDTRTADLEQTSARLQKVFALAKKSASGRIFFFLDACHTGLKVEEAMRGQLVPPDFAKEKVCAGFASCRTDEKSYSAKKLGHGIWTYHLLEAFAGNATEALDGEMLTVGSLQKYLADQVPRSVRKHLAKLVPQTPVFFGSFEKTGVVADISSLLARRRAETDAQGVALDAVSLVSTETVAVSSLGGFNKKRGYQEPDRVSDAANRFVASISADELKEHIDEKRQELRTKLKLKLKELEVEIEPGNASIRTPWFDYHVSVRQSHEDPSSAEWHYVLSEINAAIIERDEFNAIFRKAFDTVEFRYRGRGPDLRKLAEKLEDADYEVDLPMDESYCTFSPTEDGPEVRVTPGSLDFVFGQRIPPKQLAEGFRTTFAVLGAGPQDVRLLLTPST